MSSRPRLSYPPVLGVCGGGQPAKGPQRDPILLPQMAAQTAGTPVFKPRPPRMTALISPRPQATWVSSLTHRFFWGGGRTHRDCQSLPPAGPPTEHGWPARPGWRAQFRGTAAACERRHGPRTGHRALPEPLCRAPTQEGGSRRPGLRPGSGRSARPRPRFGCIMGNVVLSAREAEPGGRAPKPKPPRARGGAWGQLQPPGLGFLAQALCEPET